MTWVVEFVEKYITIAFRNICHVFKKVEESKQDKEDMTPTDTGTNTCMHTYIQICIQIYRYTNHTF